MTLIILPGWGRAQTCLSRENSREEVSGGLCLCFWFRSTFSVVSWEPCGLAGLPSQGSLGEHLALCVSASERGQKENTTRFWNWIFQPVPKSCRRAKCSGKQMRSPLSQRCAAPKWLNGLNLIYLNRTWGLFSRMLQHKYLWFTLTLQFFCWFLYL